jgi:hypothetical protein
MTTAAPTRTRRAIPRNLSYCLAQPPLPFVFKRAGITPRARKRGPRAGKRAGGPHETRRGRGRGGAAAGDCMGEGCENGGFGAGTEGGPRK